MDLHNQMQEFAFFHTQSPDMWLNSQQMQVRFEAAARRTRPTRVPCMAGLVHAACPEGDAPT